MMPELPHHLNRTVVIGAKPETVFRFFTDSARWAAWWGEQSTIDARPGGKVYIRYPNGIENIGEVLEVHPDESIVFTYGYVSGNPIPPGASRVTIRLEPDPAGTRLHLTHEFDSAAARDQHIQGWRFQLSLFANAVTNEVFADAATAIDKWYGAWAEPDAKRRNRILIETLAPEITFRDRYSLLCCIDDISAHIAAAQHFMPGIVLKRAGSVRHCQGSVLADWIAVDSNGQEKMKGANFYQFAPDGRISLVIGFTS